MTRSSPGGLDQAKAHQEATYVAGTGVDPVTSRFSGARSAN